MPRVAAQMLNLHEFFSPKESLNLTEPNTRCDRTIRSNCAGLLGFRLNIWITGFF